MSLRRAALSCAVALAAVVVASDRPARAHQPSDFDANRSLTIADPLVSYAIYADIDVPDAVYEVKMNLATPAALPVEVLVPRRDHLEGHRPVFAIVGAGLPEPTAEQRAYVPREIPAGMGVLIASGGPPYRESIFESFTRRVFWTNGVTAHVLPAGEVRILIWSPGKTTGPFVFGIGVEEAGIDFGNVIGNWGKYAY